MKTLSLFASVLLLGACTQKTVSTTEDPDSVTVASVTENPLDTTGGKGVYFVNLKDSQEVSSPVSVQMGVKGMMVEKAGAINDSAGHHHIIVDGDPTPLGETVPSDENHIHFGQGQTETELKLTPGKHTLTLQFANGMHASYGSGWSKTITVFVK